MTQKFISPHWQPTATLGTLRQRAEIIKKIREFFAARNVLEVETPLLSHAGVTDPHVHSITAHFAEKKRYLQTSPEYAMKRLLAAGSGPIYQISKAFRYDETAKFHNPEFTMLEWYQPGYDHHLLMNEMDALLQTILKTPPAERLSYAAAFENYVGINPHAIETSALAQCVQQKIQLASVVDDRNTLLDLLLTHCIEPHIGQHRPVFLYDFPVTQAALAKVRYDEIPPVASRFEVYFKGIELANGFHELQNAAEQRERFEKDLQYRAQNNMTLVPIDENFLAALTAGLPDCAGVALGVDRLIMLSLQCATIAEVMSFSFPSS